MLTLKFAHQELARLFSRPILQAAVVVMMIIPLFYGAMYLWAFWDPYSHLDAVPVAIVNLDKPAQAGDKTITAGNDLVDELTDKGTFEWHQVSAAEAARGVQDGTYYDTLTIPADFSARLATADSKEPVKAQLHVAIHESKSMIGGQIAGKVFSEVRRVASDDSSKSYYDSIFVSLSDASTGLKDAASGAEDLASGLGDAGDGARKLSNGASDAKSGGIDLASGLGKLKSGAATLAKGTGTLSSGTGELASGASKLADGERTLAGGMGDVASGAGSLEQGIKALEDGSAKLAQSSALLAQGAVKVDSGVAAATSKIASAAAGANQVSAGAAALSSLLDGYVQAHPEAAGELAQALGTAKAVAAGSATLASGLSDAKLSATALATGADQVSTGAGQVAEGASQLDSGMVAARAGAAKLAEGAQTVSVGSTQLVGGASALSLGARKAAGGAEKLVAGSKALASGLAAANTGAAKLAGGLGALDKGALDLADGLDSAVSGSRELADGLTAGAGDLPSYSKSQRAAHAEMMSDPVGLQTKRIDRVPNYGTGFAPYFIPLALWVGGLIVFIIINPLPEPAVRSGAPGPVAALSGLLPAALMAVGQTILLYLVMRYSLGLHVVNAGVFFAFVLLTAAVFLSIQQWLSVAFGPAGKVFSIVILMLQLTSAAGTFPIQTLPHFFQAINPWLPMTYVVSGLREAISGGDWGLLARDTWVLLAFGAATFAGTSFTAVRARKWDSKRLKPLIDL